MFETIESLQQETDRNRQRAAAALRYALKPQVVPTGQTPREVVWTRNKAKLYRYHSRPEGRRYPVPLLLVYALINRPYILDLMPGNSLVEYLVGEGYDVFLLDWGLPGEEDAGLTIDDYVIGYLPRAARQVLRFAGARSFSMLGYCMGGTFAALYAALYPEDDLQNLILLTAPIDFTDAGLYSTWLDTRNFNVDRVVETFPLVPAEWIDLAAKLLKPLQNCVGPYVKLWDRIDDPEFVRGWQAIHQWVNDGIPFAGAAYRQWVREFYQENRLIRGELHLGGRPVRLDNIHCSVLNVYSDTDHIVPPCQSAPFLSSISSPDAQELVLHAGHVGVMVGHSARKESYPRIHAWLAARSLHCGWTSVPPQRALPA